MQFEQEQTLSNMCFGGDLKSIRELYEHKNLNINKLSKYDHVICAHLNIVKWIHKELKIVGFNDSCFIYACRFGYCDTVQYYLANNLIDNETIDEGLYFACVNGLIKVVKTMFRFGNKPTIDISNLIVTFKNGHFDVLRHLCKQLKGSYVLMRFMGLLCRMHYIVLYDDLFGFILSLLNEIQIELLKDEFGDIFERLVYKIESEKSKNIQSLCYVIESCVQSQRERNHPGYTFDVFKHIKEFAHY